MQSVAQMLWQFIQLPIIPIPSQNICRSALTRGRVTVYIDGFSIDDWSISFPFLSLTLTCIIFFLSSVIISSIIFIIITRPKPAYGRQGLDWIIGPGYSFVVFSTNISVFLQLHFAFLIHIPPTLRPHLTSFDPKM